MNEQYIKKELVIGDFKHHGYFTEFELARSNLLFVDPLFYIDSYYDQDFDSKHIYNRLLLVFYQILKYFFRGQLKLVNWRKDSIKSLMTEYLLFRNILVNNRYEKDAEVLLKNNSIVDPEILKNIDKENYLKLIVNLYCDLDSLRDKIKVKRTEYRLAIKDFDGKKSPFDGKEYSTVRFMQSQIKKRLSEQVDFFLIQGSYATADFIKDWSDLDTHVILNKNVFNDIGTLEYAQKELRKLSLLCYKINPLAHHTLFIFPDLILKHYLNVFLPMPILDYSLALHKRGDLILQHLDSRPEEFSNFWSNWSYLRKKVTENNYSKNLLDWEQDVGTVIMLPALAVQAKEGPIYKKFSFERIKKSFPGFDFSLIDWASKKRREWKLFNLLRFYPNAIFNLMPVGFNNYLFNKYRFYLLRFKKIANLKEVEEFTKKSLKLHETIFLQCLNNYKENV